MDPDALWTTITTDADPATVEQACTDLQEWIDGGGAYPTDYNPRIYTVRLTWALTSQGRGPVA